MLSLDPAVRLLQTTFEGLTGGGVETKRLETLVEEIDREIGRAEEQAEYTSWWAPQLQERALNSARELRELRSRVLERIQGR